MKSKRLNLFKQEKAIIYFFCITALLWGMLSWTKERCLSTPSQNYDLVTSRVRLYAKQKNLMQICLSIVLRILCTSKFIVLYIQLHFAYTNEPMTLVWLAKLLTVCCWKCIIQYVVHLYKLYHQVKHIWIYILTFPELFLVYFFFSINNKSHYIKEMASSSSSSLQEYVQSNQKDFSLHLIFKCAN